jgi:hypothetical protein
VTPLLYQDPPPTPLVHRLCLLDYIYYSVFHGICQSRPSLAIIGHKLYNIGVGDAGWKVKGTQNYGNETDRA